MDETATSAHYARMKHIYLQIATGLAATFTIGASTACAQQQDDGADSVIIEEADDLSWNDQPQTQGRWNLTRTGLGDSASFLSSEGSSLFTMMCIRSEKKIGLRRSGQSDRELMMRVRTETTEAILTVADTPSGIAEVGTSVSASSPLLDAMAITQGRFAIEVEGMEPLYLPAWAEVTRVIEDCR